ncbi:MAG: thioredoxin [Clostridia bacterium]|nr:thioredoxin [Clostridia bacterium]MDD4387446.1 thioredoxin [Clostridia bacterium]
MLKHIDSNEFLKEVLENKKAVLVDFYASWCPPCKMLAPILEKISTSRADFDIIKVNIDENQDLAMKYKIEVVPTMVVFKDGKSVNKMVGLVNESEIVNLMLNYID